MSTVSSVKKFKWLKNLDVVGIKKFLLQFFYESCIELRKWFFLLGSNVLCVGKFVFKTYFHLIEL